MPELWSLGLRFQGFNIFGFGFFGVAAFIKGSAGDRFLSLEHLLATKIPITLSFFPVAGKELHTTRRQLQFEWVTDQQM